MNCDNPYIRMSGLKHGLVYAFYGYMDLWLHRKAEDHQR